MTQQLLGPDGAPIATKHFAKVPPPKIGEQFGNWTGRNLVPMQLPGGGLVQFDLNKLTLQDYRTMKDHYQVNASLSVLSFMQHQASWHIECDDPKMKTLATDQLLQIWTQLNRSMSQANWAGYSPCVLQWENEIGSKQVVLTKVKDLLPEECYVEWREVPGYAPPGSTPPKIKIFNGINQVGQRYPIPIGNAYWYPLLMENGDYYGRKLLRPAYTSYFFSILIHLFSNRYYERFGEPVPVGRAPFDEEVDVGTAANPQTMKATDYMLQVLQSLRNRSAIVLPADRGEDLRTGYFEYDVEYLESQMRGADFSRYNSQLNEEISLALFTPILLLQTADVGSYNLGVGHMQMYLWMLNAMNDDRATYINKYVLAPMAALNGGKPTDAPRIVFRRLGNTDAQTLTAVMTALVQNNQVSFDLDELGAIVGMSLKQVAELTAPTDTPAPKTADTGDGSAQPANKNTRKPPPEDVQPPKLVHSVKVDKIQTAILQRVGSQVRNAYESDRLDDTRINIGFKNQLETALGKSVDSLYMKLDYWTADMVALGKDYTPTQKEFMDQFTTMLNTELTEIAK